MKRSIKLLAFILIINIFLAACTSETVTKQKEEGSLKVEDNDLEEKDINDNEGKYTVRDYFPFKKDTLYEYKGIGDEFANQKTYMEFIDENKAQMKIFNPGLNLIKVLEYRDGEIYEVYSEGDFNHIEKKLGSKGESESIVLKDPIQIGNSWTISGSRKREITSISRELDLPYGRLKAVEVITELGEGRMQLDYYSLNLGHVASIYKDGDFEVKTLLQKIHRGSIDQSIRYFYPLENGSGMVYKDRKFKFKTNDSIETILEEGMRNPDNETLIPLISKETKINKIEMDKANNILKVDLNRKFLDRNIEMGSSVEVDIVQSLVNTLGEYYETNKVFISIDGKAYSSDNIELETGEYLETIDNAIKIVD